MICVSTLNSAIKIIAGIPRPTSIAHLVPISDNSLSFPSGDVQLVSVFWLTLAYWYPKAWLKSLAGSIIILVACSHVYLGDVLGGFTIGLIIFLGYIQFQLKVLPLILSASALILYTGIFYIHLNSTLVLGLSASWALWIHFALSQHKLPPPPEAMRNKLILLCLAFIQIIVLSVLLSTLFSLIPGISNLFKLGITNAALALSILRVLPYTPETVKSSRKT